MNLVSSSLLVKLSFLDKEFNFVIAPIRGGEEL